MRVGFRVEHHGLAADRRLRVIDDCAAMAFHVGQVEMAHVRHIHAVGAAHRHVAAVLREPVRAESGVLDAAKIHCVALREPLRLVPERRHLREIVVADERELVRPPDYGLCAHSHLLQHPPHREHRLHRWTEISLERITYERRFVEVGILEEARLDVELDLPQVGDERIFMFPEDAGSAVRQIVAVRVGVVELARERKPERPLVEGDRVVPYEQVRELPLPPRQQLLEHVVARFEDGRRRVRLRVAQLHDYVVRRAHVALRRLLRVDVGERREEDFRTLLAYLRRKRVHEPHVLSALVPLLVLRIAGVA